MRPMDFVNVEEHSLKYFSSSKDPVMVRNLQKLSSMNTRADPQPGCKFKLQLNGGPCPYISMSARSSRRLDEFISGYKQLPGADSFERSLLKLKEADKNTSDTLDLELLSDDGVHLSQLLERCE